MINKLKDYFKEHTKSSSLRLSMFIQTIAVSMFIFTIGFHVVWSTVIEKKIDWTGLSLIFPAIGTFAAAWIYGKVRQKKIENEHKNNNNTNTRSDSSLDESTKLPTK